MNITQLNSTPFAITDLENVALRIGMCFRILPEDLALLQRVFPEEIPETLLKNRLTSCIAALGQHGLIDSVGSGADGKYYAVPSDVMQRLEAAYIKQENLSQGEYDSHRKKCHAQLARVFLEEHNAGPSEVRIRCLAEGLVQMRRAEEWAELERVFHVAGMHLFGTHDSYIRSEEHTSELQSRGQLVCRHLLQK